MVYRFSRARRHSQNRSPPQAADFHCKELPYRRYALGGGEELGDRWRGDAGTPWQRRGSVEGGRGLRKGRSTILVGWVRIWVGGKVRRRAGKIVQLVQVRVTTAASCDQGMWITVPAKLSEVFLRTLKGWKIKGPLITHRSNGLGRPKVNGFLNHIAKDKPCLESSRRGPATRGSKP